MPNQRNWWWYIDRIADYESHMHAISKSILTERTEFQEVGIVESPVYGKILILDGDMQSAELDEFVYHEALVHPAMTIHPDPASVLIIGGGEGATLREVIKHRNVGAVHMLDIDRRLVEICRDYLPEFSRGAFTDPRLNLIFSDANKWIRETSLTFDVIISDLTEPMSTSPSGGMFSPDFFQAIRSRLKSPGVFAMQASRGDLTDLSVHSSLYRTLSEVFHVVRSYLARVQSFDLMWAYLFASETIDPLSIESAVIDETINAKIQSELKFYDGETHRNLFSLPRYFRKNRDESGQIMQDGEIPLSGNPTFLL